MPKLNLQERDVLALIDSYGPMPLPRLAHDIAAQLERLGLANAVGTNWQSTLMGRRLLLGL